MTLVLYHLPMATVAQFQQHYADLRDEELIHIALTCNLVPEAKQALAEELSRRGISDLSSHKALMVQEATAEEGLRQKRVARQLKISGWHTKIVYSIGILTLLYGVFRAFIPNVTAPADDVCIALGLVVILFTWLRAKISKIWVAHVFRRQQSRIDQLKHSMDSDGAATRPNR